MPGPPHQFLRKRGRSQSSQEHSDGLCCLRVHQTAALVVALSVTYCCLCSTFAVMDVSIRASSQTLPPQRSGGSPESSTTSSGEPPLLCGGNVCELARMET